MIKRILLWPDTHVPYEDKQAVRLALKVQDTFEPDITVVLGDFIDAYPISDFPKRHRANVEDEIDAGKRLLEKIKPQVFLEGNHEFRLPTYVAKKCPELAGLIPSMQTLLGLEKAAWYPYRSVYKVGRLHLSHDFGAAGAMAHVKAMNDVWGNTAHGHTHHFGIQYKGNLRGTAHFGASIGCLADKSKVDYMNRAKCAHWVHGVGLGYLLENGNIHLTLVPFVEGVAMVNGKIIRT